MQCPVCDYAMDAFDKECPRCHGRGVPRQHSTPPVAQQVTAMPLIDLGADRDTKVAQQTAPVSGGTPAIQKPGVTIGGIIALLALAYWMFTLFTSPFSPVSSVMPTAITNPVVTMAEYNQCATGMTYEQVSVTIGQPGQENSRVSDASLGLTIVGYQWVNPNGSNMQAQFQNNQLTVKAQAGLQ